MWCYLVSKNILKRNLIPPNIRKIHITSVSNISRNDERCANSTIDSNEVKHFSNSYHHWWDINGSLGMLHAMNEVRIPLIRDTFMRGKTIENELLPFKNQNILDVGCGGGILSEGLAALGANVTGLDASVELIEVAKQHIDSNLKIADYKPTYYSSTIEDHANIFKDHYDGIVASEVIEHVNQPELFVKACVQALKPGGRIFFTTPNRTRFTQFMLIFFCEYVLKLLPKGTHHYEKLLAPKELTAMLESNNCTIEHSSGILFNPLSYKWRATNSQIMIFVLQAKKITL